MSEKDPDSLVSSSTEVDSNVDSSSPSPRAEESPPTSEVPVETRETPKVEQNMLTFASRMSRITEWPVSDLKSHLVRLELEWNELTVLPASISALESLEYLSLNHNHIHTIEEDGLTKLTALKYLDLSHNALTSIPFAISNLTNLTYLSISKNRLTVWPTGVHALKNLETFGISSNAGIMGRIPDSFGDAALTKLTTLRIGELGLNEIPMCIAKLTTLTSLDVEINSIRVWPDYLVSLRLLKRLDMMLNDFPAIPPNLSLDTHPDLLEVSLVANPVGVPRPIVESAAASSSSASSSTDTTSTATSNAAEKTSTIPKFFRFGFVASPNEIVPGVFLGSIEAAYNKHRLRELGVTHVVSLVEQAPPYPLLFKYLLIEVPDIETTDLFSRFDNACRYIDSGIKNGGCLIHCQAGMSRSATITIAWVMKSYRLRFNEAHDFVREKRPIILPNPGFVEQLQKWEAELEKRGMKFSRYDPAKLAHPPSDSKCVIS